MLRCAGLSLVETNKQYARLSIVLSRVAIRTMPSTFESLISHVAPSGLSISPFVNVQSFLFVPEVAGRLPHDFLGFLTTSNVHLIE